jgi:alpha-D-xyloside xylohydrolase
MKLVVYGLEDGKTAECEVYDKEAVLAASVKAVRNGDTITVTVTGTDKPFTVESAQGLNVVINK